MPKITNGRSYLYGYIISVILTLLAFGLVILGGFSYWLIIGVLLGLATIQLFVQLYFFLHLNDEAKPRWKFNTFVSAAIVVFVVVLGSLWIMQNLAYHHGHDALKEDYDSYIQEEEAIYKDEQN